MMTIKKKVSFELFEKQTIANYKCVVGYEISQTSNSISIVDKIVQNVKSFLVVNSLKCIILIYVYLYNPRTNTRILVNLVIGCP